MPQSTPHYHPWGDEDEIDHMTEEEILQFIEAAKRVGIEKEMLRKKAAMMRQRVPVPKRMPPRY